MAVFGAPVAQDDHAERALAAARVMSGERLERFNASLAEQGIDHRFTMGIGLNSGAVLSGNVGSMRRMEYTALGDTTNTAARLEAMTKDTPHQVLVAQATVDRLGSPDGLAFVEELAIRGRVAPVRVWSFRDP
jgi:adenylate cyclase